MTVHFLGLLRDPQELVEHPQLEPEVKRAILASWASDAHSVRSEPRLRKPPELSAPMPVSDVLAALRQFDAGQPGAA